MKLYVDDQRPAPAGWIRATNLEEAVSHLRTGNVEELSVDYDLGDSSFGTGLDVLDWLAGAVHRGEVKKPKLHAHSGSPLGRRRLELRIDDIEAGLP